MKYNVGDRVRIQSLEWHQKEIESEKWCSNIFDVYWCSREMTISKIEKSQYLMEEDGQEFYWTDEMIEGLVEESDDFEKMYMESEKRYEEEYSKGEYCHEQSFKWGFQEGYDYAHENEKLEINLKNGYQFVDENGNVINATNIVLEKKKKEYPKTYEECYCVLLERASVRNMFGYKADLMVALQKLLVCRDAYWKIAGEEMGLGKPWEPDWEDDNAKYSIFSIKGILRQATSCYDNAIFAFPTPEMRDAFKKNFDADLEFCKVLL